MTAEKLLIRILGFWAASLYTLLALQASSGDWQRFWLGKRWHEDEAGYSALRSH